jgi:hypothetical protein
MWKKNKWEEGRARINPELKHPVDSFRSGFAVIGAGNFGNFIIQQLLKDKAAGTVKEIDILTRQVKYLTNNSVVHDVLSTTHYTQGSKTTVQGDAKVIQVDYSKDDLHQASSGWCARCHQYHPVTGRRGSDENRCGC